MRRRGSISGSLSRQESISKLTAEAHRQVCLLTLTDKALDEPLVAPYGATSGHQPIDYRYESWSLMSVHVPFGGGLSRREVLKRGAVAAGGLAVGSGLWVPRSASAWDGASIARLVSVVNVLGEQHSGAGWPYSSYIQHQGYLYCAGAQIGSYAKKKYNTTNFSYSYAAPRPSGVYTYSTNARSSTQGPYYDSTAHVHW